MSTPSLERYRDKPLLDLVSYGRREWTARNLPTPTEEAQIWRTIERTPEVMVKVMTRGGTSLGHVGRHFEYLSRKGELDIETDDGQRLAGNGVESGLLEDWDLDLEAPRRRLALDPRPRQREPRLVHKLVFSMPPGTPADRVHAAVKDFAREEFALKHRYALVLHTDEPHPHVHLVVKAMSEQGKRLNIKRATLRAWRAQFAEKLRDHGVEANATERAVRGLGRTQKLDPIYRAQARGYSSHLADRRHAILLEARETGRVRLDAGATTRRQTHEEVVDGWKRLSAMYTYCGDDGFALRIWRFMENLPAGRSERELTVSQMARAPRGSEEAARPPMRAREYSDELTR